MCARRATAGSPAVLARGRPSESQLGSVGPGDSFPGPRDSESARDASAQGRGDPHVRGNWASQAGARGSALLSQRRRYVRASSDRAWPGSIDVHEGGRAKNSNALQRARATWFLFLRPAPGTFKGMPTVSCNCAPSHRDCSPRDLSKDLDSATTRLRLQSCIAGRLLARRVLCGPSLGPCGLAGACRAALVSGSVPIRRGERAPAPGPVGMRTPVPGQRGLRAMRA